VLVQEVDVVGAQQSQAVLDDLAYALGATVHSAVAGAGEVETELGGDDDVVAETSHRFTDDSLVFTCP
jgi:hypothetical protein